MTERRPTPGDPPAERGGQAPTATRSRRGRAGATIVGALLAKVAGPAFAAHGFPSAAVLADWPAIAGADLAAFTTPERLTWPRRVTAAGEADAGPPSGRHARATGATLVLRVDGPRALEVQHEAPQLVERVNAYFGYAAVARLRIVQGPVRRRSAASRTPARRAASAAPEARLDGIEDDALRAALARLAARVPRHHMEAG